MQTTDEQVRQLIHQAEKYMDREEWDEVAETLEAGRHRLIADYLMGEEGAYAEARAAFDQALAAADDKAAVLWWLGKIYAHHGYFAEASETLEQMADLGSLSPDAHRLYGEVRWWRDNDRYICWVL